MPTYEYECLKCKYVFETFQKMSDVPLENCPKCKGKVKKLISSGSGLIFKGSGFYATDYKKNGNSAESKKENDANCSGCEKVSCPNNQAKK